MCKDIFFFSKTSVELKNFCIKPTRNNYDSIAYYYKIIFFSYATILSDYPTISPLPKTIKKITN